MGEEGTKLVESKKQIEELGVTFVADLGTGLYVAKVPTELLREQDINARVMDDGKFKQLVKNIKKRGTLESLPLCAYTDRGIEIVSGHHRIKASKEAGIKEVPVLLDVSGLNRSQIAAKQLAHNAISGVDDENTLKEIAKLITDVDDMLESAIDEDIFKEQKAEIEKLSTPAVSFDWKTIQFTFLPHQIDDLDLLIEKTHSVDYEGVADIDQFKPFIDALEKTQKFQDIKAVGTAINYMIKTSLEQLGASGYDDEDIDWVQITKYIGGLAIPVESGEVIKKAIDKMIDEGLVDNHHKWMALEYMAQNYLDNGYGK